MLFDIRDLSILRPLRVRDFLNTKLCASEPTSFWRDHVIAVVTFLAKKSTVKLSGVINFFVENVRKHKVESGPRSCPPRPRSIFKSLLSLC